MTAGLVALVSAPDELPAAEGLAVPVEVVLVFVVEFDSVAEGFAGVVAVSEFVVVPVSVTAEPAVAVFVEV